MNKVELNIIGLTYSQSHNSAYALLLGEIDGVRRLPIVIGRYEAQSIAIAIEDGLVPERPLSHDLFTTIALTFNLYLKSVIIHKLKEGVFYSYLVFEQDGITNQIDSRTSDAVALALRFNCPIFTYEEILKKAGIVLDENSRNDEKPIKLKKVNIKIKHKSSGEKIKQVNLISISKRELEKQLIVAIEKENYERAVSLRDEINRRKNYK